MTTTPNDFETHSTRCLAQAVISAVENIRDEEVWTDEGKTRRLTVDEFRARMADVVAVADGYLADGLQDCRCHVAPIKHVVDTFMAHPGDTPEDRRARVAQAQSLAEAYLQNRQISPQDYIYLVKRSEGRA